MSTSAALPNTDALAESTNKRKAAQDAAKGETAASKKKAAKKTSPHDLFFEKKQKFQNDHGFLGAMLVKGIERDDDDYSDDEQEEEEQDTSKYSKEQMDSLRFILINQKRADKLDEMRKLVLGDQAEDGFLMFNTSFSYEVLASLDVFKRKLTRTKNPADKMDLLIAYTYTVKEYDVWMHDNEGGMDKFTKGLAAVWKRLLKQKSDEELGLDAEYTKPGVMEMLAQFRKSIESMDSWYGDMKFRYK